MTRLSASRPTDRSRCRSCSGTNKGVHRGERLYTFKRAKPTFGRLSARLHSEFVVILMSPDPSPKESVSLDEMTDSAVMITHSH